MATANLIGLDVDEFLLVDNEYGFAKFTNNSFAMFTLTSDSI